MKVSAYMDEKKQKQNMMPENDMNGYQVWRHGTNLLQKNKQIQIFYWVAENVVQIVVIVMMLVLLVLVLLVLVLLVLVSLVCFGVLL